MNIHFELDSAFNKTILNYSDLERVREGFGDKLSMLLQVLFLCCFRDTFEIKERKNQEMLLNLLNQNIQEKKRTLQFRNYYVGCDFSESIEILEQGLTSLSRHVCST